jgi:hypothetical protein
MKIVQCELDYIDPSLKERIGEAIHNRYYDTLYNTYIMDICKMRKAVYHNEYAQKVVCHAL